MTKTERAQFDFHIRQARCAIRAAVAVKDDTKRVDHLHNARYELARAVEVIQEDAFK